MQKIQHCDLPRIYWVKALRKSQYKQNSSNDPYDLTGQE
jgi:hypothetical protein